MAFSKATIKVNDKRAGTVAAGEMPREELPLREELLASPFASGIPNPAPPTQTSARYPPKETQRD